MDNLSWLIHSKSLMLDTSCSTSLATTSLAWTSMTIRADSTACCIFDRPPLTSCTKSPSFGHKMKIVKHVSIRFSTVCTMFRAKINRMCIFFLINIELSIVI